MKCLKRLFLLFLLLFLFVVPCSFSMEGQTIRTLDELQTEYQQNTERLNLLSVQSEIELMDLQIQFPELRLEVSRLQTEVTKLIEESKLLGQDSKQLVQQLTELNTDIEKLSESLDRIEILTFDLETSLKRSRNNSNMALLFAGGSLLSSVALFFYFVLTGTN